jgi:hypothetical protein
MKDLEALVKEIANAALSKWLHSCGYSDDITVMGLEFQVETKTKLQKSAL